MNKLSVIMPAFNEANTIQITLQKVVDVNLIHDFKKEIIIVNDCSNDNTEESVQKFILKNH
jgi:glycosyltransferase involved in cell wall biosynthesis